MSAATALDPDEPSLPSLEGVRVLLAVADHAVRTSLETRLLSWDVSVGLAVDLAKTVQMVADMANLRTPYDVVLVDAALLGGSVQALSDAQIEPSRVIVLTAPGAPAFGGGVQSLAKGVQPSQLYGELARAIDRDREADAANSAGRGNRAALTAQPPGHPDHASRVLVAEDNANNRLVAVRMLQHRGLAVDIAVDGHQAVAMHREAPYDAIFMDCMMPVLDGYEATREIRRSDGGSRHTPIIAMTANTMPGDADRCLVAGMDFYSPKPISAAGLDYVLSLALPTPDPALN
jgi:CheY-like chemotaxis protein